MRIRICTCTYLLVPGLLLATGVAVAGPGNTFHEDFATHDHADLVQTTAIWDLDSDSIYPPPFPFDQLGVHDTAGSARHIDIEGDLALIGCGAGAWFWWMSRIPPLRWCWACMPRRTMPTAWRWRAI